MQWELEPAMGPNGAAMGSNGAITGPNGATAVDTVELRGGNVSVEVARAYAWAETEIGEWMAEADEEASAIINRARAEALRCELAGHEELERLREEAVRVRISTAERVARRLDEARSEADQVLARAGAEAEVITNRARRVVLDMAEDIEQLRIEQLRIGPPELFDPELSSDAGTAHEAVSAAATRLRALLEQAMVTVPGAGAGAGGSGGGGGGGLTIVLDSAGPGGLLPVRLASDPESAPPALVVSTGRYCQDDVVPVAGLRTRWRQRWDGWVHRSA